MLETDGTKTLLSALNFKLRSVPRSVIRLYKDRIARLRKHFSHIPFYVKFDSSRGGEEEERLAAADRRSGYAHLCFLTIPPWPNCLHRCIRRNYAVVPRSPPTVRLKLWPLDCMPWGLKKGDVVLLVSPNSIMIPCIYLGILSIGALHTTCNPLNTEFTLCENKTATQPFFCILQALPAGANSITVGATSVVMPIFDLEEMVSPVQKYRQIGSGGAPLGKDVIEEFGARFLGIQVTQVYGFTESSRAVQ
eukprot:Gb_04815 [translate_table: standard]